MGRWLGQPFDERSPWKSSAEVNRHRDLMSAQRGFFVPGDPVTPRLPGKPGNGENLEKKVSASKMDASDLPCDKFCCE